MFFSEEIQFYAFFLDIVTPPNKVTALSSSSAFSCWPQVLPAFSLTTAKQISQNFTAKKSLPFARAEDKGAQSLPAQTVVTAHLRQPAVKGGGGWGGVVCAPSFRKMKAAQDPVRPVPAVSATAAFSPRSQTRLLVMEARATAAGFVNRSLLM